MVLVLLQINYILSLDQGCDLHRHYLTRHGSIKNKIIKYTKNKRADL